MAKIVSVHAFRGGTGKSNLIANVAAIIAMQGQRVGIVDSDIQSPGIHTLFNLDETTVDKTLNDYLWGDCVISEAAYDVSAALKMPHVAANSLFLIPANTQVREITRIVRRDFDGSTLTDGFYDLIRHLSLDYLFIDTHPGLNEETLLTLAVADVLLVVLRPDQQDYQGTAVLVEVARELGAAQMFLVVNKVLRDLDFEAMAHRVEAIYHTPVAAVLPLSEEMIRMGSSDLFTLRYPEDPYALAVQTVARLVLGA